YDGSRDNPAPSDQLSVVAIRLKSRVPAVLLAIVTCGATACGSGGPSTTGKSVESVKSDRYVPRIGRGPRYRFPPASRNVAGAVPVGALHCARSRAARVGVHLEVFANRLDVVVPAGIGVAKPVVRKGAYVTGGRCLYPARTLEPTGLI